MFLCIIKEMQIQYDGIYINVRIGKINIISLKIDIVLWTVLEDIFRIYRITIYYNLMKIKIMNYINIGREFNELN
jgi:hypothetical protein